MDENYIGTIETSIRVKAKIVHFEDTEHYVKLSFDERTYLLFKEMLETGAPVYFGLQKTHSSPETKPDDKEV
jgi:hypothetical protein